MTPARAGHRASAPGARRAVPPPRPAAGLVPALRTVAGSWGDEAGPEDAAHRLRDLLRTNKLALFLDADDLELSGAAARDHEAWRAQYRLRTAALNGCSLAAMHDVSARLDEAGVPHAFFKGPVQHVMLHDDPLARPSGDVDVLVTPRRFDAALAALTAAGYHDTRGQSLWWRHGLGERHLAPPRDTGRGGSEVDLHLRLGQAGCPAPRDVAACLARATRRSVQGRSVPFLCLQDTALMTAASLAKAVVHRQPCGSHVLDYVAARRLVSANGARMDAWRDLVRAARDAGMLPVLRLAQRCARALLAEGFSDPLVSGPQTPPAAPILADVEDEHLVRMILAPATVEGPRRRALVWELHARDVGAFASEGMRAALGEVLRIASGPRGARTGDARTAREGAAR